jgi:hypothetical protein
MSDPFGDKRDPLVKAMARADRNRWGGEIKQLTLEKSLLVELVLDTDLSSAAKNLIAIAIRDGGMPSTDETRVWYKLRGH